MLLQFAPLLVEYSSVPPVPLTEPMAMLPPLRVQALQLLLAMDNVPVGALSSATVKVAWQVLSVWQGRSKVKVTVVDPPQANGAPLLLLLKTPPQPPETVALANQLSNATPIAVWV